MTRETKCPNCGKPIRVSSHWENATCPNCHAMFEIGVEIFELTEEEQKRETEAAQQKIKEEEDRRSERQKETKRRLRKMMHLPEPDPHADVEFEKPDDGAAKTPGKNTEETSDEDAEKKKKLIIIGAAGAVVLFIIITVIIMIVSTVRRSGSEQASAETDTQTDVVEEAAAEEEAAEELTEATEWTDGFSVDSNPFDGRYKVDLQSSDSGEQRDPYEQDTEEVPGEDSEQETEDAAETETETETVSEQETFSESETVQTPVQSTGEISGRDGSASDIDNASGGEYVPNTADTETVDMLLNGFDGQGYGDSYAPSDTQEPDENGVGLD